mgnify:CR=1 FL=1
MTELKEIPTDKLVEELISRKDTEKIMPRWYFVNRLIQFELSLLDKAERRGFEGDLTTSAIRLAEVLLND